MKLVKSKKRYCPKCKKHTDHKVQMSKQKTRSSVHPLSHGSNVRIRARGLRRGFGNLGRYSKPSKPKMTGKKQSKKTDLRYECKECKKMHIQSKGFRAKKIEFK
ncbi:MAG: 50S ribosomal protein L44e [Nanoarchaeota archaeon]|nr:50S ribosomal protein L44e [Nanoarchaeota archaeon]